MQQESIINVGGKLKPRMGGFKMNGLAKNKNTSTRVGGKTKNKNSSSGGSSCMCPVEEEEST